MLHLGLLLDDNLVLDRNLDLVVDLLIHGEMLSSVSVAIGNSRMLWNSRLLHMMNVNGVKWLLMRTTMIVHHRLHMVSGWADNWNVLLALLIVLDLC